MAYEAYNIYRQSLMSSTPSDSFINNLQALIDRDFNLAPNYHTILKLNRTTEVWENVGARFTRPFTLKEKDTLEDDNRNLAFTNFDVVNNLGDLFEFDGYRWMTIDNSKTKTFINSCQIKRCNVQLKFVESTPLTSNIITIDGISEEKMFDQDAGNYVNLPSGNMNVYITNNTNGKKIRVDQRFLLGAKDFQGRYQAWKVVNVDTISYIRTTFADDAPSDINGMIKLRLVIDNTNTSKDNHTVGVAWNKGLG